MKFVTGEQLTTAIRVATATSPVAMAVAFWGNDALALLGLPKDLNGYRIVCDAYSGACSPKAIGELLAQNAKVKDVSGLHAKVYHSPNAMVVSSANASTNGLCEDATDPGLEAGMYVVDAKAQGDALKWFNTVFEQGTEVNPWDIPRIDDAWEKNRSRRPTRMTLASAILSNAPDLADGAIKAYIYPAETPAADIRSRYAESPFYKSGAMENERFPFFWGEIPEAMPGDEMLCFEVDNKVANDDGIWRILGILDDQEPVIYPALEITKLQTFQVGNMPEIAKRIGSALAAGRLKLNAPPISLTELAAALVNPLEADFLEIITAKPARVAYTYLLEDLHKSGLMASFKPGVVPAVRFHDDRARYVMAFIPNSEHLLFYLRLPLLKAHPGLAQKAVTSDLHASFNPAGEVAIRLETLKDARELTTWLRTNL